MHALDSDEKLSVLLEFVLVSEDDLGEGGASAWVVNDVLNNALDVSEPNERVCRELVSKIGRSRAKQIEKTRLCRILTPCARRSRGF